MNDQTNPQPIEAETVTVGASKVRLLGTPTDGTRGELPTELPSIPGNELPSL